MSIRLRTRRLRYHVSSLCTGFIPSLLHCTARSSTTIGVPSQLETSEASPCEHSQDRVTINTLPDHVLVEIFHFYVIVDSIYLDDRTNKWHTLVRVCQRWRHVVFASPRRLNVRLEYTGKRPMSEMLDVWPTLPVVIRHSSDLSSSWSWENVAAVIESEHRHRICEINLWPISTSEWERLAAAMQKPFPELTHLRFYAEDNAVTSLSDSFLGGSAPLLRHLSFGNCPFPGIPKLLLSSNQLVVLSLWNIPNSGYISPQDLVTALSVLSRLEFLDLGFEFPLYPASRPPPPLITRSVLPALTFLTFRGVHEYLEDLLAQIEVPFLKSLEITFFMVPDFVLPQLHRLISDAKSFETCNRATVRTQVSRNRFQFSMSLRTFLSLEIRCREFDSRLASLAQACSSAFPLLSNLMQLEIVGNGGLPWTDDMETTHWLELLDSFSTVKILRLSPRVAPHVCRALVELAEERPTDVLPALRDIILDDLEPLGSVLKYIERFVAARNLSGHPVAVHRWTRRRILYDPHPIGV